MTSRGFRARVDAENADKLRAKLAEGFTVAEAARALGWSRDKGFVVSKRHGIRADPAVVAARQIAGGQTGGKVTKERWSAPARKPVPAPPNPKLSARQQYAVSAHKARIRNSVARQFSTVPLDDADRLIAEAIAAGKVTRCPPAATPDLPHNALVGWR